MFSSIVTGESDHAKENAKNTNKNQDKTQSHKTYQQLSLCIIYPYALDVCLRNMPLSKQMSTAKKRAKRVVRETHIVKACISIAIIATLTAHDASVTPQNTVH